MTTALLGILAASLLGSAHCAAMCGGFVCFYAADGRELRAHVLYNGGRLASYVFLGGIAGALGAGITRAGAFAGIGRAAAVVAGGLMIVWGAAGLLNALGVAGGGMAGNAARRLLEPVLSRTLDRVRGRAVPTRALVLGVATTLLPCGWLYVFVAAASATGSPLRGAAVMGVFWLGTVPAMAAVGLGAQRLLGPLRRRAPAISAAAILVIGLLTLSGRLMMAAGPHGH